VISLAMIVRNEAARLAACLASAGPAVDEIVVVDTGSTDDTREVAHAHGARVIDWAWRDDFAAARNESLRHAAGDWVLVLDADERLAPDAASHVRGLATAPDADGYDCRLVSALPADEPAPAIAHWYCRLFRRAPHVRFEGRIHEQVAPSIRAAGGRIRPSDVVILHEGYAVPSEAKTARNVRLLRQMLAERPGDPFARLHLGMALCTAGDTAAAADAFEQAATASDPPLSPALAAVAWMRLGELRLAAGSPAAAATAAERALHLEPSLTLARYVLGRALFEQGAVERAGTVFESLATAPPDALGLTLHRRVVAIARAVVRLRQRRWDEAIAVLEPVVDDDATGEVAFHLGNARLGAGRIAEALGAYRAARARGFAGAHLDRRLALVARLTGAEPATTSVP
jgi:tetratricopeptide (TPR) repeat protein